MFSSMKFQVLRIPLLFKRKKKKLKFSTALYTSQWLYNYISGTWSLSPRVFCVLYLNEQSILTVNVSQKF